MIRQSPPPGFITAPWDALGLSRQAFYRTELNTLWSGIEFDAYRPSPNTPTLYAAEDVDKLAHWLFVRRGLIVLGLLSGNAPLKPDFNVSAWFDEGHRDIDCPKCGRPAVADWGTDRIWCEKCGIMPEQ